MFKKLLASILIALHLDKLPVKEGKVEFTADQKKLLQDEFAGKMDREEFSLKLCAAINKHLQDETAAQESQEARDLMASILMEADNKVKALENTVAEMASLMKAQGQQIKESNEKIAKLSKSPEDDYKPVSESTDGKTGKKVIIFNPRVSHRHVALAKRILSGAEGISISASGIDVSELQSEFGTYLSQNNLKLEIMRKLMQPTFTMQFMRSIQAITEWRASQAEITSVVQQFTSKWTPLGSSTFHPITIQNRRHKLNVPITPADVLDSWIMYLYDESLAPEQMPIVSIIINNLIIPKSQEDREMRLIGKGIWQSAGTPADGDPGQPTGLSVDGFLTILRQNKASATSHMNFFDDSPITDANVVDKFNDFVDWIDDLYKNITMPIFCSRETYTMYKRAYQLLYPVTKNVDANSDLIDFSNNRLQPLPSMSGEDIFFATPPDNFIRLRNINDGAQKIFLQTLNYDVKVFAEWWEAPGFAIEEAVFAYVPDNGSGSGSDSGSGSAPKP